MAGYFKDAYERYIHDVSQYSRIDVDREIELSSIIQHSKSKKKVEAALEELVQSNLLLVVHCLKQFSNFVDSPTSHITRMDLIGEGNIGLMRAAKNFDAGYTPADIKDGKKYDKPIRFCSYACECIKNHMRRAMKLARFIHIPEHHFGYWRKIRDIEHEFGEDVDDQIVMDRLDIDEVKLQRLRSSQQSRIAMLEDFTDCDGQDWADMIASSHVESPGYTTSLGDLKTYLMQEMDALPPRTKSMLSQMFLQDKKPTLADLSKQYGISKERCRQVCQRGLQLLKRKLSLTFEKHELLSTSFAYTADNMLNVA